MTNTAGGPRAATMRHALALSTALTLSLALSLGLAAKASAQATPGDRSGTPDAAGPGQSAATPTQAPAPSTPTVVPAAHAARGGGGGGDSMGEIIVTARRVEERLQDVPISITVFNQKQLDNRNIVSAGDLATYTPSLSSNGNFGAENTTFAIRGFVQEINTTPSVGVYFADVVAPRGAGTTPSGNGAGPGSFFDLQNVQVLKGPQGTLFGINTTGGAVLLVPQKPTAQFGGYIEGSYGNYDMNRVQAVVNLPVGDRLRLRFGIDHQTRAGYAVNSSGVGPSRFDDIDYTALRASAVFDVTPNIENYTIASYTYSGTNGTIPRLFACNPNAFPGSLACGQLATAKAQGAGFYTVQNDLADAATKMAQWQIINTTTWRVNDNLTVKNIASYAQLREVQRENIFGTNWYLAPGLPITFTNVRSRPGAASANQATTTDEIQFQGNAFANRLTWQAGGFGEISDPLNATGSQSPTLLSCSDSNKFQCSDPVGMAAGTPVGNLGYQVVATQYIDAGIYGQGTYSITDKLKLTGGLRYTWDRTATSSEIANYYFPTPNNPVGYCGSALVRNPNLPITSPADCHQSLQQISQAPTWLIDLDYKPTRDLLLYAKYARGYRQGSIGVNAAEGYQTFKPEQVDTYELGSKTSFTWPVRGTFDIDGFYNAFAQQQIQVGFYDLPSNAAQPNQGIVNAGKSQIYGAEVESTIYPVDGVSLNVSYAYLDTLLESLTAPPLVANSRYNTVVFTSKPGGVLPLAPKHKLSLTGAYILPLPSDIGKVTLSATYTYTSSMLVSYQSPYGTLPETNLLNLNLTWTNVFRKPFDISAFATNVTQDNYFSYVAGIYSGGGFESGQLGEPRMYGVRVKYHFGH